MYEYTVTRIFNGDRSSATIASRHRTLRAAWVAARRVRLGAGWGVAICDASGRELDWCSEVVAPDGSPRGTWPG